MPFVNANYMPKNRNKRNIFRRNMIKEQNRQTALQFLFRYDKLKLPFDLIMYIIPLERELNFLPLFRSFGIKFA